ncbi:MAG: cell division protein FtsA [bacterium]|nr:cell division protein FtsA [bacterium]
MSRIPVITAIDLGTDKCATLIATVLEGTSQLQVVGVSVVPSRGMKRSTIINLEQVVETMTESLDAAERMAGFDVKNVFLSFSGTHIGTLNSKGVVAVASPTQEIAAEDVDRVIEAARAISLPTDREIVHVIPRNFKVDSQDGIKDPVGMTGVRLEAEVHIVTGMSTAMRNLEKCVNDLGLQVDGFVFSGLAATEVVLSETEKELGVVVADIGAGSTSICAYVDGALAFSGALPIGARHITQDIALGCRVSLDSAEKIKVALSKEEHQIASPFPGESKEELNKRRKKADELDVKSLNLDENVDSLSKRALVEGIMVPRMKEICQMIKQQLDREGLTQQVPAGLVITGGGAETVGLVEVAKRVLNLPVRVGKPVELGGLVNDIQKPSFATSIGLLQYGRRQHPSQVLKKSSDFGSFFPAFKGGNIVQKLVDAIKSVIP